MLEKAVRTDWIPAGIPMAIIFPRMVPSSFNSFQSRR